MTTTLTKPETCIECGEVICLKTSHGAKEGTSVLVQTEDLQVTRMGVPAGRVLPPQRMIGDMTMQCVDGRVGLLVCGEGRELKAGQIMYLPAKESFAVTAHDDSVLLLTMVLPNDRPRKQVDAVQEASEESFPASDPPSH